VDQAFLLVTAYRRRSLHLANAGVRSDLRDRSTVKSIHDRVIGKSPRLNFGPDGGGIELHVFNTRDETIITERIEAAPPLLGFSAGHEMVDLVRAVVAQRGHGVEQPIAVLSPGDKLRSK
jgi:hypothetical protein